MASNSAANTEPELTLHSMRPYIILVIVAGLLFTVLPAVLLLITPHPMGSVYDQPRQQPDFTLPNVAGGDFTLSEQRGKVVILYFGYSFCPDVCPSTLYTLRQTMQALGSDAQDVQVVFVTIDPERDTPAQLRQYLDHFDPRFIGLRTDLESLQPVMDLFGVVVQRAEAGEAVEGYPLTHTTSAFVIDREGYLTLRIHHNPTGTENIDLLVKDLRYVLRGRL